jgi:orotidine-5'-phosphate decarboxylase
MARMTRDFKELLNAQWERGNFLCVGLDPDYEKIPEAARRTGVRETIVAFNRTIVDATKDIVCAFKPNSAFYEAHGDEGWNALRETIGYINEQAPDVPVILDAKRADIGNTNRGYVESAFEHLRADAITVHPYLGSEAIAPFLERREKGIIVLCRTSNPGAKELQDLNVGSEPLYKVVARLVAEKWNSNGNCGLVVGATYPGELAEIRALAGAMPILIPGVGAQGGDLEKSVSAGKDAQGRGFMLAISRAIIYASAGADYAEVARYKAQEFDGAIRKAL